MKETALKKEIHLAIDHIQDEEFLQAVYIILSGKLSEDENLNSEWEEEVDKRIASHKSGKSKNYSWSEAKKLIKSKIKK